MIHLYSIYTFSAPITSVSFTKDGQSVVVGSADNKVRLIDKISGQLLGDYSGHTTNDLTIECGVLASDNHIASGSATGQLWLWDLVSSNVIQKCVHSRGKALNSISVHPVKDIVLTASVNTIKLWEQKVEIICDS